MAGAILAIAEIFGRENFWWITKNLPKVYALQYNKTGHHKSSHLLLLLIDDRKKFNSKKGE